MQQNQAIIVCSVYQSETSESIVRLIRDLCPSQEIIFQPLQKTTQFDGKKVVFCHSSCSGRLALTDVNDSIYDSAVKDASRTVGKENVAFVVTDVEATDVYLRRKMITQTQHTLVSETNLLLLLGKVDDIDGEVLGQFKEFLTIHSPQLPPFPPQGRPNQPPYYYDLIKSLPQLALMVIIIACLVSVNSRLDLFQSHINMLRQESFDRIHHLEQTLKVEFQSELKTKIEDLRKSLTENMGYHTSRLRNDLRHWIDDVQTNVSNKLQTELQNHSNVQRMRADHINQTLFFLQKTIVDMTLKLSNDKTTLETLRDNINDFKKDFQNKLETKMEYIKSSLSRDMEEHRSMLTDLASQITKIQTTIMEGHSLFQDSQYSELINVTKYIRNNLQTRMDNYSQLQAELHSTINDMQMRIEGRCSELQALGKGVQSIHTRLQNLQDSVGRLK